jgi:hypothetical protein
MIYILHIIILIFFLALIFYSLFYTSNIINLSFKPLIEGIDGCNIDSISNDPLILSKTNSKEIEELKKKMDDLKNIKSKVDSIDEGTKQNTEGIKKLAEQASNQAKDKLGSFMK